MIYFNLTYWWLIVLLSAFFVLFSAANIAWSVFKFQTSNYLKDFLQYSKLPSVKRRVACYILYTLGVVCCALAVSEPYIFVNVKDKQYQNVRLIFVVDVSRSMVYAEDVPPNRLAAVKKDIKNLYMSLDGRYECSILPFAGDSNPYFCPFTTNKRSFLLMLDELDWKSAPALGTDLTKAVEAIKEIYINQDKIDKSGLNVVLLFSDGGKEEALATDRLKLLKLANELGNSNFRIYTVGVGGEKPTPLIIRDEDGGFLRYVTQGEKISYSQLDEEILKQISNLGKGKYYNLNASSALAYDMGEIVKENRTLVSSQVRVEKLPLQAYLFSVTVGLLLAALLLNKV